MVGDITEISIVTEVVKTIPSLGVLVFLVWFGVNKYTALANRTMDVVQDNTRAMSEHTSAVRELRQVINQQMRNKE